MLLFLACVVVSVQLALSKAVTGDTCEVDGTIYKDGDRLPTEDNCVFCKCAPHEPQQVSCMVSDCAYPLCVDPTYGPDGCCLICPNGKF